MALTTAKFREDFELWSKTGKRPRSMLRLRWPRLP